MIILITRLLFTNKSIYLLNILRDPALHILLQLKIPTWTYILSLLTNPPMLCNQHLNAQYPNFFLGQQLNYLRSFTVSQLFYWFCLEVYGICLPHAVTDGPSPTTLPLITWPIWIRCLHMSICVVLTHVLEFISYLFFQNLLLLSFIKSQLTAIPKKKKNCIELLRTFPMYLSPYFNKILFLVLAPWNISSYIIKALCILFYSPFYAYGLI